MDPLASMLISTNRLPIIKPEETLGIRPTLLREREREREGERESDRGIERDRQIDRRRERQWERQRERCLYNAVQPWMCSTSVLAARWVWSFFKPTTSTDSLRGARRAPRH